MVTSIYFLHLKLIILSLGEISFFQGWLNWDCVLLVLSLHPFHEVILAVERRNEIGTKREVEPKREVGDG